MPFNAQGEWVQNPEPTFPGTTTPIGNIGRSALSNYSDYRNLLNIPRIGNTRYADIIRGRAERTAPDYIGQFTDVRKTLGVPRLQDTDLAKIINEGLVNPESTPSFKLGQRLINERGVTQKEDFLSSIGRAGLGGSGIALRGLNTLGRQGDIDIGNLALTEGINTRNAALSFVPKVEDSFLAELNKAYGLEEQGITDLGNLEGASQSGFLNELGLGLRQEELAKTRETALKIQEMKNQAGLGTVAGNLLSQALPNILEALRIGTSSNALAQLEKQLGLPAGSLSSAVRGGATGLGAEAAKKIIQLVAGGGGEVASLTQALVDSGMSQADAGSLIQQVLAEDAGELANIGQFDPSTFLPENNPFLTGEGGGEGDDFLSNIISGGGSLLSKTLDLPSKALEAIGSLFPAGGSPAAAAAIGSQIPADVAASTQAAYESILPSSGGLIGSTGLGAALTAIGIPLSFVLGSLPFIGQRKKIEAAKEAKYAATYDQQIQADPQGWVNTLAEDPLAKNPDYDPYDIYNIHTKSGIYSFGPAGEQIGKEALAGTLTVSRLKKLLMGEATSDLPMPLSNWAGGIDSQTGVITPIALEANRQDLANWQYAVQHGMNFRGGEDPSEHPYEGQYREDEEGNVFRWNEDEERWQAVSGGHE